MPRALGVIGGAVIGGVLLGAVGFAVGWFVSAAAFPSHGLDALATIGLATIGGALFGVFVGAAVAGRVPRHPGKGADRAR